MTFYKHLYRALASGLGHVTALKYCLTIIIIIIINQNTREYEKCYPSDEPHLFKYLIARLFFIGETSWELSYRFIKIDRYYI